MRKEEFLWSRFPWRKNRKMQEPGAALFQGLRVRLTLWYCGVFGLALVLFCIVLYIGASFLLLNPAESSAQGHAWDHEHKWLLTFSPDQACSDHPPGQGTGPDGPGPGMSEMIACYNRDGTLIKNYETAQLPAAFLTNTVAETALQSACGCASDTVDAGGSYGTIYRYAVAVPGPSGQGYVGVVIAGTSIQAQNNLLSILLILLLSVGGATLLSAGLGGLFLASRALAPAHLAFTRQQRFIADASHELRTPLTLMRADAEVILRGRERLAEEDVVLLEDIVAEASHMSVLANSMLALARLDANVERHEHEVVDLNVLAGKCVQRVNAFAEQKGVVVRQESTDGVVVIGDPSLLEQALLVLLDNAIKYNRPGGRVTVRVTDSNNQARLEVVDTGIGIAAEHLSHLGERFYRVDKARSREAGGTGLGLSIARRIAAIHHGQLAVSSVPEQGTTVTLVFPQSSLR